jgi:hypothetical protein
MADRKKPRKTSSAEPPGFEAPAFPVRALLPSPSRHTYSKEFEQLRATYPKEMARVSEIIQEFILAEMGVARVGHKPLSPKDRKRLQGEMRQIFRSMGIAPQHKLH